MSSSNGVNQSDRHCAQTISIIPASKVAFSGEDIIIFATGTVWLAEKMWATAVSLQQQQQVYIPTKGTKTNLQSNTHTHTDGSEFLGLIIGFPSVSSS